MKKVLIWSVVGSVILNLILILFLFSTSKIQDVAITDQKNAYPFLSPRIFLSQQNDILINFIRLRTQMRDYVEKISIAHPDEMVGVYFEYLPSGISIGVNEKEGFVGASLLKVPLAIAVYNEIEKGSLAEENVLTLQKTNINPLFGPLWKKGPGAKITLAEALHAMISQSDNTAASLLINNLPQGSLEEVFDSLDIPKELGNNKAVVSPKNYSSILRSLYLSSILSKKNSNELLDLLTQSNFDDKITAPIPKNIKVAHKIGVYEPPEKNNLVYTDCGIVFVPKRPYIICVMSRSDENSAKTYMKDLSQMIYSYVAHANYEK